MRRCIQELRPVLAAPDGFGRRADQPGRMAVVLRQRRRPRPIVDTFWQTEPVGRMITPMPGATPLVPGSCTLPFPGIQFAVVDEDRHRNCRGGQGGILVVQEAVAVDDPHHLGRSGPLQKSYYPVDFNGKLGTSPATAPSATRRTATSRSPAVSTTC